MRKREGEREKNRKGGRKRESEKEGGREREVENVFQWNSASMFNIDISL